MGKSPTEGKGGFYMTTDINKVCPNFRPEAYAMFDECESEVAQRIARVEGATDGNLESAREHEVEGARGAYNVAILATAAFASGFALGFLTRDKGLLTKSSAIKSIMIKEWVEIKPGKTKLKSIEKSI